MASILPPVPRFIFTVLEPLLLLAGWAIPVLNTHSFVTQQLPSAIPSLTITSTDQILALQLGNCYGLLSMIAVSVLYSSTESKVVRNFLIACAIADVGHVYACYHVMGAKSFLDIRSWNEVVWGNIGITTGLFISRILYFAGAFGKDKVVSSIRKKV